MKEYNPVIIKVKDNGSLDIDEEKLKKLLEDAYQQGYNAGYVDGKSTIPNINPINPIMPTPRTPDYNPPQIWCTSNSNGTINRTIEGTTNVD